jgi:hypothetical protein
MQRCHCAASRYGRKLQPNEDLSFLPFSHAIPPRVVIHSRPGRTVPHGAPPYPLQGVRVGGATPAYPVRRVRHRGRRRWPSVRVHSSSTRVLWTSVSQQKFFFGSGWRCFPSRSLGKSGKEPWRAFQNAMTYCSESLIPGWELCGRESGCLAAFVRSQSGARRRLTFPIDGHVLSMEPPEAGRGAGPSRRTGRVHVVKEPVMGTRRNRSKHRPAQGHARNIGRRKERTCLFRACCCTVQPSARTPSRIAAIDRPIA